MAIHTTGQQNQPVLVKTRSNIGLLLINKKIGPRILIHLQQ